MKTEIIKPRKEKKENKSILTPIIYIILGFILAFRSNEAVMLIFYIIGLFIIAYGIKSLLIHYQNKDKYNSVNLGIAITSIILGVFLIILAQALEISIRYILGFFLLYMGLSRFIVQISIGDYKNFSNFSNIVLIILGIYSILFSNAVLVIIGWLLIINACILFFEYFKN